MKKEQKLINLVYSSSKYWGKHIVILGGKIYAANTGREASRMLEKLIKKFPSENPIITYVPGADALILLSYED